MMLDQALALHKSGRLAEAERRYRLILRTHPGHPDALRLLGMLEVQRGNFDDARNLLARARGIDPDSAAAHGHLGDVLKSARRFDEALASYDQALAMAPDAAMLNDRGITLIELGRVEEALQSFDRALAEDARFAAAHFNRALALASSGRNADALAGYDAVLVCQPDSVAALNNRGSVLAAMDRVDDAIASWDRVLALRPDFSEARANRAAALLAVARSGRLSPEDALAAVDRVLAEQPRLAEAHANRGSILMELGRYAAALDEYDEALTLKPDLIGAHGNRSALLSMLARHDEALASFERALAIDPRNAEMHAGRGAALTALRRHEEAGRAFAQALAIDPDRAELPGLLQQARAHCCDWTDREAAVQRVVGDARAGRRGAGPLVLLAITDSAQDQAACARAWVQESNPGAPVALWRGERYDHARIRVAYLSADLDEHPVAYLLAGVFESHDRRRFETIAVSSGPDPRGGMRERLKAAFDRFIDVRQRTDGEVAALLRELEVDVAVDLNGHTQGSRLGALALRPSPVQVSYLGYPGTTGAAFVDYVLADRFVVPETQRAHFAEKLVYLPDTFQANDRKRSIAAGTPTRAEMGLPQSGFVFCSLNNSYKITPAMFDVWMRLLQRCEGSVLWLQGGEAAVGENLRREARDRGIEPTRLVFARRLPYAEHLARYRLADLFLDTLPFNGGATVSDALWAGLPVLTCTGEAMAARMAGSLLHAACLPELVTNSVADYEAQALALALAPQRLAVLKSTLARGRDVCALFDTDRFRRHLEAAYIAMWERARRGEAPAGFAVPSAVT